MSPAFGGWGGRYVWRRPNGESRAFWSQGGDSYPGNDTSRDTVVGTDGKSYTSDQATIWRWRTAFQHDFAARMDWSIKEPAAANHNPRVVVNGARGTEPLVVHALVGHARDARRGRHVRPGPGSDAALFVVLLPRSGHGDSGTAGHHPHQAARARRRRPKDSAGFLRRRREASAGRRRESRSRARTARRPPSRRTWRAPRTSSSRSKTAARRR